MSEIHIGELKSDLMTELDTSDTEQIFGGTYISHSYHGYYGGKISFKFKKFNLKDLLKIYNFDFKGGHKKYYSYSHAYNNGKGHQIAYNYSNYH